MKRTSYIIPYFMLFFLVTATSAACRHNRNARQQPSYNRATEQESHHTVLPEAKRNDNAEQTVLQRWEAGKTVDKESIEKYGITRCFTKNVINDSIYKRIYGLSFKRNCTVALSSLRYLRLLHYTTDGNIVLGEMICHKDIADDLIDIFHKLYDAHYPIERMLLIDNYDADDIRSMEHNNTSCFNYRPVAGTRKLSNHSLGKAVDLNPLYNPYVKRRSDGTYKISPAAGRKYVDRTKASPYKIDHNDLAYKLFKEHGFRWGGDYRTLKDYQHFEK